MQALADRNDGNRYMLTVIDIFSKIAFVRGLKNKSGAEVTLAFDSILKEGGAPRKCRLIAENNFLIILFRNS
jgi:hypothetical protein